MGRLVPEHIQVDGDVNVNVNLNVPAEQIGKAVENVVWAVAFAALTFNRFRRKP